jgi:hypothetical protein
MRGNAQRGAEEFEIAERRWIGLPSLAIARKERVLHGEKLQLRNVTAMAFGVDADDPVGREWQSTDSEGGRYATHGLE